MRPGRGARRRVIVVGVDHSEPSRAALRFAIDEARLREATLRAVHVWQLGYMGAASFEGYAPVLLGDEVEVLHRAAETALATTLKEIDADSSGVEVEHHVVEG